MLRPSDAGAGLNSGFMIGSNGGGADKREKALANTHPSIDFHERKSGRLRRWNDGRDGWDACW